MVGRETFRALEANKQIPHFACLGARLWRRRPGFEMAFPYKRMNSHNALNPQKHQADFLRIFPRIPSVIG
jgi:hypothetical protein